MAFVRQPTGCREGEQDARFRRSGDGHHESQYAARRRDAQRAGQPETQGGSDDAHQHVGYPSHLRIRLHQDRALAQVTQTMDPDLDLVAALVQVVEVAQGVAQALELDQEQVMA